MAQRAVLHVVYRRQFKAWMVTGSLVVNTAVRHAKYVTKPDAIEAARDLARAHQPSQVRVHKRTGQFEREFTYGADPKRYKS